VVVAVLPTAAITVAQPQFPALQPAREGFHGSAFLESPQRPPLI
jgi:hypothetical protein